MLMLAAVVAIPVGVFCGICLSEYRKNWFATIVSYLTDLLQGTPSIIIGISRLGKQRLSALQR